MLTARRYPAGRCDFGPGAMHTASRRRAVKRGIPSTSTFCFYFAIMTLIVEAAFILAMLDDAEGHVVTSSVGLC